MQEPRRRRNREHKNSRNGCFQCKGRKAKVNTSPTRIATLAATMIAMPSWAPSSIIIVFSSSSSFARDHISFLSQINAFPIADELTLKQHSVMRTSQNVTAARDEPHHLYSRTKAGGATFLSPNSPSTSQDNASQPTSVASAPQTPTVWQTVNASKSNAAAPAGANSGLGQRQNRDNSRIPHTKRFLNVSVVSSVKLQMHCASPYANLTQCSMKATLLLSMPDNPSNVLHSCMQPEFAKLFLV